MELEIWSFTSSHSATRSWQTPWLKNTSRSSWASQSMCTHGLSSPVYWPKVSHCDLSAISIQIFTGVCNMTVSFLTRFQTKEDCRLSQRCCGDQTEDVHPLHWVMASGALCLLRTRNVSVVGIQTRAGSDSLTLCACPQAMSILLLPHNIPDSLKHLSNLVDDIWYYAGDRSTDVSGSHRPRSPPSSTHTFLSPFHHHPRNLRPATSQVTLYHLIRTFHIKFLSENV